MLSDDNLLPEVRGNLRKAQSAIVELHSQKSKVIKVLINLFDTYLLLRVQRLEQILLFETL